MKVSYSNYPVLEKLKNGSLYPLNVLDDDRLFFDKYLPILDEFFEFYNKKYSSEINVVSNTFYESVFKTRNSLTKLLDDISILKFNGCYIVGDFVCMISANLSKKEGRDELSFFAFDKQGELVAVFFNNAKHTTRRIIWASKNIGFGENIIERSKNIYMLLAAIVAIKMFKDYADVETKIIPPNSRVKKDNYKYINDTKLELTYLDSKWFTNIVKSDGFSVSGHFRLQPKKKNGQWTKEIIFISEFQKTGYTSRARKLSVL